MIDEPMRHHRHRDKQAKRLSGRRRRRTREQARLVKKEQRPIST